MDRFYLGQMTAEINRHVSSFFNDHFGEYLTYFYGFAGEVEADQMNLKWLPFLFALDPDTPGAQLLSWKDSLDTILSRYQSEDLHIFTHAGRRCWVPPTGDGHHLALQFYSLEEGLNSIENRLVVAQVLDDPDLQWPQLPHWIDMGETLPGLAFQSEVMNFAHLFLAPTSLRMTDARLLEQGFWRTVNLACTFFCKDTYNDLVAIFPERFRDELLPLPDTWALACEEGGSEALADCARVSFRLCQNLLEQ